MASHSSSKGQGKGLEEKEEEDKGQEKSKNENNNVDTHVKLDYELIESLKNSKNWGENIKPSWSTVAEEEIKEMSMGKYDFDYVLKNHLLDEEIVWDNDVWSLQNMIGIPPSSYAKDQANNKENGFEKKKEKDKETEEKKEENKSKQ